MNPRKDRGKDGIMKIRKLRTFELHQLISVLEIIPSDLLSKVDTNTIILHTGCSRCDTGFIDDFLVGNLMQL